MRQITIQLNSAMAQNLEELAAHCMRSHERRDGFTTHGPLTVSSLMTMLAEDTSMVITRPGSWEGSNMAQLLSSHGYDV